MCVCLFFSLFYLTLYLYYDSYCIAAAVLHLVHGSLHALVAADVDEHLGPGRRSIDSNSADVPSVARRSRCRRRRWNPQLSERGFHDEAGRRSKHSSSWLSLEHANGHVQHSIPPPPHTHPRATYPAVVQVKGM